MMMRNNVNVVRFIRHRVDPKILVCQPSYLSSVSSVSWSQALIRTRATKISTTAAPSIRQFTFLQQQVPNTTITSSTLPSGTATATTTTTSTTNSTSTGTNRGLVTATQVTNNTLGTQQVANAAAATTTTKTGTNNSNNSSSNVIIDNIGSIFLSLIGLVIASLIRSHYGTKNRQSIRDTIEETSAIDPLEIHELRTANKYTLTTDIFHTVIINVIDQAKNKDKNMNKNSTTSMTNNDSNDTNTTNQLVLTYSEFVTIVRTTMIQQKGNDETNTIQCGHLLDRVVAACTNGHDTQMPVTFWLTLLLLAVQCPINDRFKLLYSIVYYTRPSIIESNLTNSSSSTSSSTSSSSSTSELDTTIDYSKKETITISDVHEIVHYLQLTCQLAPDAQIIPTTTKYPTQQYTLGTPQQMVQWEQPQRQQSSTSTTSSSTNDNNNNNNNNTTVVDDEIDLEAFRSILCSKSVCVWGECYNRKIPF